MSRSMVKRALGAVGACALLRTQQTAERWRGKNSSLNNGRARSSSSSSKVLFCFLFSVRDHSCIITLRRRIIIVLEINVSTLDTWRQFELCLCACVCCDNLMFFFLSGRRSRTHAKSILSWRGVHFLNEKSSEYGNTLMKRAYKSYH